LVSRLLPPDLVADLGVELAANGKPNVTVSLAREPTANERQRIEQVVEHAVLHDEGGVTSSVACARAQSCTRAFPGSPNVWSRRQTIA
jgi:hypothetical protein